ncbi:anthranilate synthase component I [Aneurinibacillus terranovensis]|uniref:anthranilate synthase component I n=1 Tax=Aneurinibacillus terranovensis TaxID=278991 RepID=UPI0004819705|nr:anthranilate synthase component I [Aneurinibacillus terranovensis]
MYTPTVDEVLELRQTYNLIPIRYTFLADQVTPIQLYQTLRADDTFLLESVEGGERWARYSFIGINPFQTVKTKDTTIEFTHRCGKTEKMEGNPLELLRSRISHYRSPQDSQLPPFTGGAIGFLGYDTMQHIEKLPKPKKSSLQLPDIHMFFVDEVIAYDHLKQEVQVIVNLYVEEQANEGEIKSAYEQCCRRIMEIVKQMTERSFSLQRVDNIPKSVEPIPVVSNISKETYLEMVRRGKEYIAAGDIFQVVLSQRFQAPAKSDPLFVYRILRVTNPSPYMYYFQTSDATVVGTSPELLVKVTGNKVDVRPIAGTRPRGSDQAEDERLREDLLADEKERAEHLMLLDLGRNDVGRVSRFGSVEVSEQMVIELYSRVMHMVSHVSGRLAEGKDSFDALLSCFPAGTVSGSPKIRAMEIINELEQESRGIYAGAIGYFSFNGNLDSCIAIRTIVFQGGQAYVQAGGGIVADSIPENEYEETRNKARAMFHALSLAEQMMRVEEMSVDV